MLTAGEGKLSTTGDIVEVTGVSEPPGSPRYRVFSKKRHLSTADFITKVSVYTGS